MDSTLFARLTHEFAVATRRRILGVGSAGVLSMFGSRLGVFEAETRKRKKKKRKQKKQSTPLHLAFRCPGPPTFIGFCGDDCRVAQVFILAAASIPDADVPVGESLLTANFAGPRLEAQTDYAAAVGRVGDQVRIGSVAGTTCGGGSFAAHGLGPFEGTTSDRVVSVFVD